MTQPAQHQFMQPGFKGTLDQLAKRLAKEAHHS